MVESPMSLATNYLGFELSHPIVPGASPLTENLATVRRLEDAGAPMIVLPSLFAEQIEQRQPRRAASRPAAPPSIGLTGFPDPNYYPLSPDAYLEHIQAVKAAVGVPVVASLNGTTPGEWVRTAALMQQAGADALELNLYELAIDPQHDAAAVEARQLETVQAIKRETALPLAVKISPYYSSITHFCRRLEECGVAAVVLFNRFAQPDVDVERQRIVRIDLSTSAELPLRLRWIGVLSGRMLSSIACSGGVHSGVEVVKALLAGAHAVQIVSSLLAHGPERLTVLHRQLQQWLVDHEEESVRSLQGRMNLQRCPDPAVYTRADYVRMLHGWRSG